MFFNDFQHLSPNINDNRFILAEKFKKHLRRGDKGRLAGLLAKKEAVLDEVEAKKKKLVDVAHQPRPHPDDPRIGAAGFNLIGEVEKEKGHLRDIEKIKAALREQMLPKEGENSLDLDFQEKQKKKDEVKINKVEKQIQKVDDEADQTHL